MSQIIDLTTEPATILYTRGDIRTFKLTYPDGMDLSDREYAWQFRRAADDTDPQWEMDVDDSHQLDLVAPHILFSIPLAVAQTLSGIYVWDIQFTIAAAPLTILSGKWKVKKDVTHD